MQDPNAFASLANDGVYFEAGVAVGLGIPVIPTCRADHLDKLHFDIKHINTLKWETPEQLARDLAKRISGVIGDGPAMLSDT
jgi:nucleoside 2-deoxyribosyltransferase